MNYKLLGQNFLLMIVIYPLLFNGSMNDNLGLVHCGYLLYYNSHHSKCKLIIFLIVGLTRLFTNHSSCSKAIYFTCLLHL